LIAYRQTTIAERFPVLNEYRSIQPSCLIEGSSFLHQPMSRPHTSTCHRRQLADNRVNEITAEELD
jgi:hypothetical protein